MLEVDEDSRLGAEILAFGKRYGAAHVPTEDAIAEFYETAVERLRSHGHSRGMRFRTSRGQGRSRGTI